MDHEGPTLRTLQMVEAVLRRSAEPMRLDQMRQLLPRRIVLGTLRDAIDHYKRLGFVAEGSKGVMWTLNSDPAFWNTVETWDTR